MLYLCIGLVFICIVLGLRYNLLRHSVRSASKQMQEIEKHPETNRQIKVMSAEPVFEELLIKMNDIYKARQQERIIYQRREIQIRREIENISHDLRTPLTSILGYVDLAEDVLTKEEERQEYLRIIRKRAKILQGFIRDFYELSRIEGENYPILLDAVHVQNTLSETTVAYYNEFEKKQIQVEVFLEEKACFIIVDKIQFSRILNNLIQNALKYAGKIFIVKQYTMKGNCIIQLQNDKNQMKEEDLKLIFDRFYTGDVTRNNQSTGLGLTISKILVEKMKGKITAKIDEDMFIIELSFPAE
jgi:signal transduction histidine kinase